jgi:hypothetical protein
LPVGVLKSRPESRLRLSTPREKPRRRPLQDSRVASTDDIHTPVENPAKPPGKRNETTEPAPRPPGQFISNELEEQTARFLREIKGLAKRRKKAQEEESSGPPPDPDQRSRRL